ncbi:MAG: cytochrome C oxidase subunit IV family protein [Gemmatimonadaceae bacterium]
MADSHTPAPATDPSHALPPAGETGGHKHHPGEKPHPTWKQYKWVALILTVITIAEVWIYYIPAFVASRLFVPSLLIMSAVKFAIVVLFYMHLRYDHKLFKVLFTGPLIIAITSVIALMFLFGQVAIRLQ